MENYNFLLVIALILLSTKTFGLLSSHVHMPQVVGALLAGIILGPSCLGWVEETDFLVKASEIGVIMLMFMAGLDTDLSELKKTGLASFIIAVIGVIVPLIGGTAVYFLFFAETMDFQTILHGLFVGVVLTATSVSITVETLREMGKLSGKVGTAIVGAAVIDDILGIIVLSFMSSFSDPAASPAKAGLQILAFFIFLAVVGLVIHYVFQKMEEVVGQKRRIAIYALAFALLLSYAAETFFGVADLTGAYFAGLILCNIANLRQYIGKKVNVASYMMFSPLFFASVGIKTDLSGLTMEYIWFALALLAVAILSKIIGCGLGAKICGFTSRDCLRIGAGMVSRGEVALIVAQKGLSAGLIAATEIPAVVLVVIATTLITPLLLSIVMKDSPAELAAEQKQTA